MSNESNFEACNNADSEVDLGVRLRVCNLSECEARCCYDGVYLEKGEEKMIKEIVASTPEFFEKLPFDFIVNGSWGDGIAEGRKTAVEPYLFKAANFPKHFNQTRCVFCSADHKCLLQLLAVQRGVHKWSYKPKACWMFPMELKNGIPSPPPSIDEADPHFLGDEYPGYTKFVPCGQDRADGSPWRETLADEISFWNKSTSEED